MQNQLQIEQLACQRGDKILFTDLTLDWRSGDFVQIEGHNGIGKTSLLRILVGLALPLSGKVRWNSQEISKCREEIMFSLSFPNPNLRFLGPPNWSANPSDIK